MGNFNKFIKILVYIKIISYLCRRFDVEYSKLTTMKRIFTTLFVAVVLCLPMVADSYSEALKSYFNSSDVANQKTYQTQMQTVAEALAPGDKTMQKAASEYVSSQLVNDICELFEPAFRKHVTESELKQLTKSMSDPKIAALQERAAQMTNGMEQSAEFQQFMAQYSEALQQIVRGEKTQDIPRPANVTDEYAKAFNSYYHSSRIDGIVMSSFRSMSDLLEQSMRNNGVANPKARVQELMSYTERNIPTALMSIFRNGMSIADLKTLTKLTEMPAYQHSMDAVEEISSNPMKLGVDLINKMGQWMENHYPQYAKPIQDQVKQMRLLL